MTLDATTIEEGLQERWETFGHTIAYLNMHYRDGSTLVCSRCRVEVQVHVNDLGGWWLSNHQLDKECGR
jgi:hypothetical protein